MHLRSAKGVFGYAGERSRAVARGRPTLCLSGLSRAVGVLVFTGLSAWDAQRLKHMALATPEGHAGSVAIAGVFALYLDFINLFLSLLRLFGTRRE